MYIVTKNEAMKLRLKMFHKERSLMMHRFEAAELRSFNKVIKFFKNFITMKASSRGREKGREKRELL